MNGAFPQVPPPPWVLPSSAAVRPATSAGGAALRFVALLWLLFLVAALLLIGGARAVFGWAPYEVVSGSMSPAVAIGDVVLVEPRRAGVPYGPPTIVTFVDRDGKVVTHRVIGAERGPGGEVHYRTKGDANPEPDGDIVAHSRVQGSVRMVLRGAALSRRWLREGRPGPVVLLAAVTTIAGLCLVRRQAS